ncbi:hypothetical protein XENOCAPTIV_011116, partial [Xenoophorus captivus]
VFLNTGHLWVWRGGGDAEQQVGAAQLQETGKKSSRGIPAVGHMIQLQWSWNPAPPLPDPPRVLGPQQFISAGRKELLSSEMFLLLQELHA